MVAAAEEEDEEEEAAARGLVQEGHVREDRIEAALERRHSLCYVSLLPIRTLGDPRRSAGTVSKSGGGTR